jgi:hypothetical protein
MDDEIVRKAARVSYFFGASLFATNFGYVIFSKKHYVTTTSAFIYTLETISQISSGCKTYFARNSEPNLVLSQIGFSFHWLSLAIFTGAYISVATQTPLLQSHAVCRFAPYLLISFMALGLCASFYFAVFDEKEVLHNLGLAWILIATKLAACLIIVCVQFIALKSI